MRERHEYKRAKQEIKDTISSAFKRAGMTMGAYAIPSIRAAVGVVNHPSGRETQIMEQISRKWGIGLVVSTSSPTTRQSAVGAAVY